MGLPVFARGTFRDAWRAKSRQLPGHLIASAITGFPRAAGITKFAPSACPRQRELLAHTYQYGGPSRYEPWGAVVETVSKLDPCEAPMDEVLWDGLGV